jgi:hypothetical protein
LGRELLIMVHQEVEVIVRQLKRTDVEVMVNLRFTWWRRCRREYEPP